MGCGASVIQSVIHDGPPTITRQALGRTHGLGDLYDATTERFCGASMFKQQLPPDVLPISKADIPFIDSKYINVNSLDEKFQELKVTGELKLSVLAGMCELGGSAEYLSQEKTSFQSVKSTLLYQSKTVKERVEINDQVKKNISWETILQLGATHVVTEIEWGANCIVTVRERKTIIKKKKGAQASFLSKIPFIGKLFTPHIDNNNTAEENEERTDIEVYIYGDVLPETLPQTEDDAKAMVQILPQMTKTCNDGKGKPLIYVMRPISHLVPKELQQSIKTFRSIDDTTTANKVVDLFDLITKLRQQNGTLEEVLKAHEDNVKCELEPLLVKIRSAEQDVKCLDDFCNKHRMRALEIYSQGT